MKKPTLLALLLAALMVLSACNLIEVDPEVDARIVLAEVNGETVTKGEALGHFNMMYSYYYSLYQAYGLSVDSSDASFIAQVKEDTLSGLINGKVLRQQYNARGLSLSEEDQAELDRDIEETYEEAIKSNIETSYPDSTLDPQVLRSQVIEQLDAVGYTHDYFVSALTDEFIAEKLREDVVKEIAVTDAELAEEYETRLASQQTSYDATPKQFGTDLSAGNVIVYRPAGYRYIKNLLVSLPQAVQDEIGKIDDELYLNSYNRYQLQSQLDALDKVDASTQETFDGLMAALDESDAELNARVADLRVQGKEEILTKAEEILALAQAEGANFDALIEEYGEDSGMTVEPAKSNGYAVHADTTTYVAAFQEAAMALAEPGAVSGLVETDYGYHILLYASDVPSGPVAQSEVADALRADMLVGKQDEFYTAKETEWMDSATVKTYLNRWK